MGAGQARSVRHPGKRDKFVMCLNDCREKTIKGVVNNLYPGKRNETHSNKHMVSLSGLPGCLAVCASLALLYTASNSS